MLLFWLFYKKNLKKKKCHGFHKHIKVFKCSDTNGRGKEMVICVFTINQIHNFKDAKPPRFWLNIFHNKLAKSNKYDNIYCSILCVTPDWWASGSGDWFEMSFFFVKHDSSKVMGCRCTALRVICIHRPCLNIFNYKSKGAVLQVILE